MRSYLLNPSCIALVAAAFLVPMGCKKAAGPRPLSGTYQFHSSKGIVTLTFIDDHHIRWEPEEPGSKDWIYIVVSDTLIAQVNAVGGNSERFLIRGDSLIGLMRGGDSVIVFKELPVAFVRVR